MQYPTITIDEGRAVLERLRAGDEVPVPPITWLGRGERRFDIGLVDDLCDAFRSIYKRFAPKGGPLSGGGGGGRFEGRLAGEVHGILDQIPKYVMADPNFWVWLTFGSSHDFPAKAVTIRHGTDVGKFDARPENYGLTSQLEAGFWSRVWMRGEIGHDPTRSDTYELATRGDQDFWRSHLLRQEFSSVRTVARAFLQFQFPDEHPDRSRLDTITIRAMAKELRRRHATIAYEFLDADGARRLMEEVHGSLRDL
jgi:hypothetical protein